MGALLERMTTTVRNGLEALRVTGEKGRAVADGLIADWESQRLKKRAALAEEDRDLAPQQIALTQQRDRTCEPHLAAIAEAEARIRDAKTDIAIAEGRFYDANSSIIGRRNIIDAELRETASPLIDEFVTDLREREIARTHAAGDVVIERTVDGGRRVVWSNRESVDARIQAVFRAVDAARCLYREPLCDEELAERFTAIREALPAIEMRPTRYQEGADAV